MERGRREKPRERKDGMLFRKGAGLSLWVLQAVWERGCDCIWLYACSSLKGFVSILSHNEVSGNVLYSMRGSAWCSVIT